MKLKILASGSNGNCYILSTPTGRLMIECGIPWWEIQKGLEFDLSDVLGCLISHSHLDHCKAVRDILRNSIDVWVTEETMRNMPEQKGNYYRLPHICSPKKHLGIKDFSIVPFETEHDAEGSVGFLLQYRLTGEKLLYLTDSYYCKYRFPKINYIMVECNYIKETMDKNVEAGLIDESLKRRLLESHFSLEHVKDFLMANDLSQCRQIILLHLSDYNSDAARMKAEIETLTGIDTVVAEPGLEVELELYPY
mgnify:CR=1 FL=1